MPKSANHSNISSKADSKHFSLKYCSNAARAFFFISLMSFLNRFPPPCPLPCREESPSAGLWKCMEGERL